MGDIVFHVQADWDSEADVWVAISEDIPGLATEAGTIEALTEKLRTIIPELLEVNHILSPTDLRKRDLKSPQLPPGLADKEQD